MKNTIQTLLRLALVAALTFSLTVFAEEDKPTFKDAAKDLIAKIRPMMAKDRDGDVTAVNSPSNSQPKSALAP
jgi:hypothetical protein